jgi:hypothetical protein
MSLELQSWTIGLIEGILIGLPLWWVADHFATPHLVRLVRWAKRGPDAG